MKPKWQANAVVIVMLAVLLGGWPVNPAEADRMMSASRSYYMPYLSSVFVMDGIGPDGGSVTSLLRVNQNPQIVYAATYGAGVFKSTDAGATWKSTSKGLTNLFVQALVVDPKNPAVLYAGTYKSGVFKTIDGGENWTATGPGLNQQAIVYALAIDPNNTQSIYAGTRSPGSNPPWGGGVFKSGDGGKTWLNHTNNLGEDWVYGLAVDPSNTNIVYAATHQHGLYKSSDGGHEWIAINSGLSDLGMRAIVIDPSNSQVLYAANWHGLSVLKSTNGGQNWNVVNNGMNNAKIIALVIDPVQPRTVYALSYLQGVFKTDDGGGHWNGMGLWPDYVYSLTVDPRNRNSLLASAVNVAVFTSPSGGTTWTESSTGLHATTVNAVAADPALPGVVYAGLNGQGLYRTNNDGQTWAAINSGLDNLNVRTLALVPGAVYAGTEGGGIFKTVNQGLDWQAVNNGLPRDDAKSQYSQASQQRFVTWGPYEDLMLEDALAIGRSAVQPKFSASAPVNALAASKSNPSVVYAGTSSNGTFRTTNSGADWQSAGLGGKTVLSLNVDRTNANLVYAGTESGSGSFWKSRDGGANWVQAQNGIGGMDVYGICQHPTQAATLFAATSQGVFMTINGGSSWTALGLNGKPVYAVLADPTNPKSISAGAVDGFYSSGDGGKTWAQRRDGFANPEIWSLSYGAASTHYLYAGTKGSGLYRIGAGSDNLFP